MSEPVRQTRTTIVRPADPFLRRAVNLAFAFALALFLFHLAMNLIETRLGYGYFRDEFYYLVCGRRLAWGYVDQGPLVALQARLSEILFGHSLAGIRALSALGGCARVFLTGLLAWALGGRRPAQALAMAGVACAPQYLGLDGYLCMNSWESCFWMSALLALLLILRIGNPRWWLLFGASAGLGLLNKPSMTFFLLALLAALPFTKQRRLLVSRWTFAGLALMLLIVAPYLHWQMVHHWPTWVFLHNGRVDGKNKALPPLTFLLTQIGNIDPVSALIWIPGLVFLLRRAPLRFLGLTYLFFLALMFALHAKDYYVVPIYPILFAAGGLAWETRFANRPRVGQDRAFAFPAIICALVIVAFATLPMDTPILRPEAWIAYAHATHQYTASTNSENNPSGPLEQFYADRFGWQEEVDQVTRVYSSLPPAERAHTAIFTSNYGEAGALDFLGHNLPPAISGHNNYFLWGSRGYSGAQVILINAATPDELREFYAECHQVGTLDTTPWAMPFERDNKIWLCRGRKENLTATWDEQRHYD